MKRALVLIGWVSAAALAQPPDGAVRQLCDPAQDDKCIEDSLEILFEGADHVFEYAVFTDGLVRRVPSFLRGDVDATGDLSVTDAIVVLQHLFGGTPAPGNCQDALDANDDGLTDLTDAICILGHLFVGWEPLPAPYPACGTDATPDDLACLEPACSPE